MMEVKLNLFKYKTASDINTFNRDLDCISNNKIWFSNRKDLNDPFEGILSVESGKNISIELYEGFYKPLKKKVNDYLSNSGILSLSKDAKNEVMWSLYSDNHKGYCVEYELSSDDFRQLNSNTIVSCIPVEYKSTPLDYSSLPSNLAFYFRRKVHRWKYEKEIRFISNRTGLHSIPNDSIKAIYIGANANKIVENMLMALCLKKNIKVFKCTLINNTYTIKFDKIKNI